MKSMSLYLLSLALLALFGACGKNNESGKGQTNYDYNNPYCTPGMQCNQYNNGIGGINSPIQFANQAQQENPCIAGANYGQQRIPISVQVSMQGYMQPNDVYLGVTSFGDVAVLQGNGQGTATLTAFLCPRMGAGPGHITQPVIGAISRCAVKPITAMDIRFPSGEVAKFRSPEFPSSTGQPFSFCR